MSHSGYRARESPLRQSSGSRLSRGGLLTTDGRQRSHLKDSYNQNGSQRPETDLYYSTTQQSETTGDNLNDRAMTIVRHRKKNSVTKMTSPRQMLLT